MKNDFKIETALVQSLEDYTQGEPRVYPIVQSTTYNFKDPDVVADLFDLKIVGDMYSRISNPTVSAFENKMAALEGGVGAVAVSSGQAATTMAILNICNTGDNIVATSTLYGGTHTLLSSTLAKIGITTTFVDPEAPIEELDKAINEKTRAVFAETIGNPGMNVLDIEKFAEFAHKNNIPLIIDNTIATPFLCRPFDFGADIIVHSATKYIDGQATCVGGVVVDSGNFDWEKGGKFSCLTEPDPDYHGLSYTKTFGKAAYITKARANILRDYGSTMSAFNAFIYLRGLETLHLRMERHSENALKVAKFLENHEKITWVNYSVLESDKYHALQQKYLPKGASGMILFGIKGGAEAGRVFTKNLQWINNVVHLGDVRTCLLHPASTTHRQLSEEQQIAAGVLPEAIRLNVGIESIDDIIKDIDNALKNI
ncbi:MAG: O-acetylhomoserine aminocarboxypropyltransferase/cysteine synthase family protein [Oscillospiraceae bacterium]